MYKTVSIVTAFLAAFVAESFGTDSVTVRTEQQGTYVGTREVVAGFTYNVFRGIRYAEAPVGQLRWAPPVPVWSRERLNATKFGSHCPQLVPPGVPNTEDCLFLNVYVEESKAHEGNTPVLVIIHGGGFLRGSGHRPYDYNGILRNLASRGIVVVSIQYRIGALGFLSDRAANTSSGNFGILDQLEALRWVQRNIGAFGGDPSRVTVYGESAGSMSVSLLSMMPAADELFQQVFLQSGGIYVPNWFFSDRETETVRNSRNLAEALGCATASSYYDCLRDKPLQSLLAVSPVASVNVYKPNASATEPEYDPLVTLPWGPIIKPDLVTRALSGQRRKRPILAGVNRDEMPLYVLPHWFPAQPFSNFNRSSLELHLPGLLAMYGQTEDEPGLVQKGSQAYAELRRDQSPHDPIAWIEQTVKMYSDSSMVVPTALDALTAAAQGSPAYLYSFDQVTIDLQQKTPFEIVPHAIDIAYMLGWATLTTFNGFLPFSPSADDLLAAEYYGQMTANFVKTGSPSTSSSSLPAWPSLHGKVSQTGRDSAEYMSLSANAEVRPLSEFHPAANFWFDNVISARHPTLLEPQE